MTKKTNKRLISMRLHPDLLKDIEDICNKTSITSRTELIERACKVFIDENDKTILSHTEIRKSKRR